MIFHRPSSPHAPIAALALVVALGGTSGRPSLQAGQWPQILGPERNGQAQGERLADRWPDGDLERRWSVPVGAGYAGPAVADGRVLIFHRRGDQERLESRSAEDGTRQWAADFRATYQGGIDPDTGPRCVPVVADGRVFVLGAAGDCHAVELASGRKLWSRPLARQYQAPDGYFGIGSTPIVVGDYLLVNIGGPKVGVVALSVADGSTQWESTQEPASYSAPILVHRGDRTEVAMITRLQFLLLDPESGKVTASFPFGRRGATVTAALPLALDNGFFLTASYGVGCVYLERRGGELVAQWSSDQVLSSQYNTPVFYQGFLYGIHGREDGPPADLRCVEAMTGQVRWTHEDLGVAHLIGADGKLLVLTVDGRLLLVGAQPEAFERLAEKKISQAATRALPALANGHLYFRDNDGRGGTLTCLRLP